MSPLCFFPRLYLVSPSLAIPKPLSAALYVSAPVSIPNALPIPTSLSISALHHGFVFAFVYVGDNTWRRINEQIIELSPKNIT